MSTTYTVTDYAVEVRVPGRDWTRVPGNGASEATARRDYRVWLGSSGHVSGSLAVRLIKRTAVITDEIIESED